MQSIQIFERIAKMWLTNPSLSQWLRLTVITSEGLKQEDLRSTMNNMERSYEVSKLTDRYSNVDPIQDAICCLNSRKAKAKSNLNDMRGSDDMVEWLSIPGYSVQVSTP